MTSKNKIISSIVIFLFIFNIAIPVKAMLAVDDVEVQSTFTKAAFDFKPFDVVQDKTYPILYISEANNKQVIAYNFETGTKKILAMESTPKRLTLNNGELFICLSNDNTSEEKKGSIAIIDTASFNTDNPIIKEKFDTESEPVFINIDKNNYIYVYSGTGYNGTLTSYDRKNKSIISSVQAHGRSAVINNTLDKLYINGEDFDGYSFSTFVEAYSINNGVMNKIVKNTDTSSSTGAYMEISPDDKFIITGAGAAYLCSENNMRDLILKKDLGKSMGYFQKAVFDYQNNNFYLADQLVVRAFDSETMAAIKAYKTNYTMDNIFYYNNKIIALTHDDKGKNYIEMSHTGELLKRPYLIKSSIKNAVNIDIPDEITFEFNKDIVVSDLDGIRLYNLNDKVYVDKGVSAVGNKLIIKTLGNIKNLKNYELRINYKAISDKNGQFLTDYVYANFSTKAKEDINNKSVEYLIETKIFSSSNTINTSVVIGKNGKIVVEPEVTLKVNGDIIIYGELINLGNIEVNGKVYARRDIKDLVNNRDQYVATYFRGENSSINSEIYDKYPSPILYMNPSDNISTDSPNIQVDYALIPNAGLRVHETVAQREDKPVGRITVGNIKSGDSKIIVSTADELENRMTKELNVHNTSKPLMINGVYPQSNADYSVPLNQEVFVSFTENIVPGDRFNQITVADTNGREEHTAHASIINDENGNPTILKMFSLVKLKYDAEYVLKLPYNAVKSSTGSVMPRDYSVIFRIGSEVTRLSGQTRYETSIKISQEGWYNSPVLVLASGENFPDALSAGPLAKKYDSPLLLSESKNLRSDTEKEIDRLNPKKIFIIGGTGSISKEIENKLISKGIEVERISGKNRYETSMNVAEHMGVSEKKGIVLVSGANFPDALSIASYAAYNGMPIILTEKDKLPNGLTKFMSNNLDKTIGKVYIVGGTGVISKALEDSIPFKHQRFSGKNRYETNFQVLSNLEFDFTYTYFSSGLGFADALSGCAMAALTSSPIILVDNNMGKDSADGIRYNQNLFIMKYILGGEGAVPQSLMRSILN